MVKGEKNVLALREKHDIDNWNAALIYKANPERYAGVYQAYADLILAKGRPAKRGEQQALLDAIDAPEASGYHAHPPGVSKSLLGQFPPRELQSQKFRVMRLASAKTISGV